METRELLRTLIRELVAEVVTEAVSAAVAKFAQEQKALLWTETPAQFQEQAITASNHVGNSPRRAERINSGALTERRLTAFATAGRNVIHTAKEVVITPLAREKARSLNIDIQRDC